MHPMNHRWIICACLTLIAAWTATAAEVHFETGQNRVSFHLGEVSLGHYVFGDDVIPRPYWTGMHAPSGERITREHPPVDPEYADHETMHPGIWMAFGDINGEDFWRNKARVRHNGFIAEPALREGGAHFQVENVYERNDGTPICTERASYTLRLQAHGVSLEWDSQFIANHGVIAFGDQEEMGLGFRLTKALSVKLGNGTIRNDAGGRNETGVWGKTARWCDYGAETGDRRRGIVIMPHPENFRPSWMHARDYGFLAANPFGRNAMTGGELSSVQVSRGESLRLRYGLFLYDAPASESSIAEDVYAAYTNPDR